MLPMRALCCFLAMCMANTFGTGMSDTLDAPLASLSEDERESFFTATHEAALARRRAAKATAAAGGARPALFLIEPGYKGVPFDSTDAAGQAVHANFVRSTHTVSLHKYVVDVAAAGVSAEWQETNFQGPLSAFNISYARADKMLAAANVPVVMCLEGDAWRAVPPIASRLREYSSEVQLLGKQISAHLMEGRSVLVGGTVCGHVSTPRTLQLEGSRSTTHEYIEHMKKTCGQGLLPCVGGLALLAAPSAWPPHRPHRELGGRSVDSELAWDLI